MPNAHSPSSPEEADPLLDLEMRVARRADELARANTLSTGLNLHCWLVAEAEVLRQHAMKLTQAATSSPASGHPHAA
jgi:hypothetical protein